MVNENNRIDNTEAQDINSFLSAFSTAQTDDSIDNDFAYNNVADNQNQDKLIDEEINDNLFAENDIANESTSQNNQKKVADDILKTMSSGQTASDQQDINPFLNAFSTAQDNNSLEEYFSYNNSTSQDGEYLSSETQNQNINDNLFAENDITNESTSQNNQKKIADDILAALSSEQKNDNFFKKHADSKNQKQENINNDPKEKFNFNHQQNTKNSEEAEQKRKVKNFQDFLSKADDKYMQQIKPNLPFQKYSQTAKQLHRCYSNQKAMNEHLGVTQYSQNSIEKCFQNYINDSKNRLEKSKRDLKDRLDRYQLMAPIAILAIIHAMYVDIIETHRHHKIEVAELKRNLELQRYRSMSEEEQEKHLEEMENEIKGYTEKVETIDEHNDRIEKEKKESLNETIQTVTNNECKNLDEMVDDNYLNKEMNEKEKDSFKQNNIASKKNIQEMSEELNNLETEYKELKEQSFKNNYILDAKNQTQEKINNDIYKKYQDTLDNIAENFPTDNKEKLKEINNKVLERFKNKQNDNLNITRKQDLDLHHQNYKHFNLSLTDEQFKKTNNFSSDENHYLSFVKNCIEMQYNLERGNNTNNIKKQIQETFKEQNKQKQCDNIIENIKDEINKTPDLKEHIKTSKENEQKLKLLSDKISEIKKAHSNEIAKNKTIDEDVKTQGDRVTFLAADNIAKINFEKTKNNIDEAVGLAQETINSGFDRLEKSNKLIINNFNELALSQNERKEFDNILNKNINEFHKNIISGEKGLFSYMTELRNNITKDLEGSSLPKNVKKETPGALSNIINNEFTKDGNDYLVKDFAKFQQASSTIKSQELISKFANTTQANDYKSINAKSEANELFLKNHLFVQKIKSTDAKDFFNTLEQKSDSSLNKDIKNSIKQQLFSYINPNIKTSEGLKQNMLKPKELLNNIKNTLPEEFQKHFDGTIEEFKKTKPTHILNNLTQIEQNRNKISELKNDISSPNSQKITAFTYIFNDLKLNKNTQKYQAIVNLAPNIQQSSLNKFNNLFNLANLKSKENYTNNNGINTLQNQIAIASIYQQTKNGTIELSQDQDMVINNIANYKPTQNVEANNSNIKKAIVNSTPYTKLSHKIISYGSKLVYSNNSQKVNSKDKHKIKNKLAASGDFENAKKLNDLTKLKMGAALEKELEISISEFSTAKTILNNANMSATQKKSGIQSKIDNRTDNIFWEYARPLVLNNIPLVRESKLFYNAFLKDKISNFLSLSLRKKEQNNNEAIKNLQEKPIEELQTTLLKEKQKSSGQSISEVEENKEEIKSETQYGGLDTTLAIYKKAIEEIINDEENSKINNTEDISQTEQHINDAKQILGNSSLKFSRKKSKNGKGQMRQTLKTLRNFKQSTAKGKIITKAGGIISKSSAPKVTQMADKIKFKF